MKLSILPVLAVSTYSI